MNLKQLEVFLAVAESGSFSRGAEATFITQSTVSQHISALESECGVKLLDRTGKGAMLTEAGKLLLHHARVLLNDARETKLAMDRFKGLEQANLRIGGSTIPGDYMIPAALPLLLRRFPGLSITLLQGDSHDILAKLAKDDIELGIVGSNFDEHNFDFTLLGKDELRLIASWNHRWCGKKTITLAELSEEPYITREPGSGTGKTINDALEKIGLNPGKLRIAACLGSNEAVKHAVNAGLGVSFVSAVSVRRELERNELIDVRISGLRISRHFYLASRAGAELSPAAKAFSSVMQEIYGEK